ncbi:lipopolysaccharide biosynthesis protein, partial [Nocardioides sp.]|uniref:lipopolysaccharide biosynthesis protein n=1 Tax=Nocardioides sp. TaxID=35761 RepID=UPI0027332C02
MSAPATQEHLGRIARGGAVGMAGAVFSAVSSFALVVIVTRGFTPGEAGLFFAVTSVFLVLAAASSLGSDTGLARFLQRYEAQGRHDDVRRAVRAAAVPALVVSTFSALVLVVGAGPVSGALGLEERGESLLRWLALALPFAVAADLALAVTRAFGRMRISVLVDRFLRAGLQPPLALVVVLAGGTLLAAAGAWAAAYVVSAAVALVASRRYLRTRLTRHRTDGPVPVRERVDGLPMAGAGTPLSVRREFWGFTWPRGVARLAQITVQKADIVIVAALLSPAHAAVYTAATRFVALGQFATHAIQQVLQPRLTAILIHDDQDTLRQVFRIATTWSILLAWPLYLVVGTAPLVYLSVFGDQYAAAAEDASGVAVVAVMAVAMLVSVAAGPLDTVLLMAGRSRASLGNALTAMTVDLVLCFLLIPVVGLVGAALAWGAAVLARTALTLVQVRRHLGVTPGGRAVIVASVLPVVCLAVPVATHSLLGAGTLGGFALVLGVGAVAYLGALFVFRRLLGLDLLVQAVVPLRLRRWVYDV